MRRTILIQLLIGVTERLGLNVEEPNNVHRGMVVTM